MLADAEWRLRSVRSHMESALSRHIATLAGQNPSLDPSDLQSLAVETLHLTGCSYATWLRYETKFERQYDRAYNAWGRYQVHQRRGSAQQPDSASPAPSPNLGPLGSNVHTTDTLHAIPTPPAHFAPPNSPSDIPSTASCADLSSRLPPPPDFARYGIAQ